MNFRLGELFCGPGGIALGAKRAHVVAPNGEDYTISHAWANDIDPNACKTYANNICGGDDSTVFCEDVRCLESEAGSRLTEIDALAFGFPCNDFSTMGLRNGMDGLYGPLYTYGIKMLERFKPKFFIAENVIGLNSINKGKALRIILDAMFYAGYDIMPHLYKFEHYNVPQCRHRIIIVGIRSDLHVQFRIPYLATGAYQTCKDAIENPPIPIGAPNHEFTVQSPQVIARLQHTKPGENAFNATLPEELRLKKSGATFSQIYRRLNPDKPAYTVTGSGGGGTHVYHWSEARALTSRERARLQTFPDDFVFYGSKDSVRKQIGMAVPPTAAQFIFNAVLKSFAKMEYTNCAPNITPSFHMEKYDMKNNLPHQHELDLQSTI